MVEVTLFECDVTGDRFGAKNDVLEFSVRRYSSSPFEIFEREVHLSDKVLDDVDGMIPWSLEWLGAKDGKIVGAVIPSVDGRGDTLTPWIERDSVVIDHYEEFFQFVEEEVLY